MTPPRRRLARDRGESFPTFFKVLIPLFLIGLAVFQSLVNKGHVDNNVIGALVFVALGGAVGYIADRFVQAWLGLGPPGQPPAAPPAENEEPIRPRRKRKRHV